MAEANAILTEHVAGLSLRRDRNAGWLLAFGLAGSLVLTLLVSVTVLFSKGIGIFGNNIPVAWAFPIANFVWWIGIGHAGTFISAFLFLMRQEWRSSVNRLAEAMTLFAVACAALYPILHLGRPWLFYWLFPYPNTMDLFPQFRSPLVFDVFAVGTYGLVSLMFWYLGLVPDLATMRDRAKSLRTKRIYGLFALGWRGAASHWQRYRIAYGLLAALATPLVLSVHSIVGTDFAYAIVPGWHHTFFPPIFVAGALYSGFAMVLMLAIPLRAWGDLRAWITDDHLEKLAKLMMVTGQIVFYSYLLEHFFTWYSGSGAEEENLAMRMTGHYAPVYWLMIACNCLSPQLLWFRRLRRSSAALFATAVVVNIGMWAERYVIVATSLAYDWLPSSWEIYAPTVWDWATFAGTIGLFGLLLLLFVRYVPTIALHEVREEIAAPKQPAAMPPGVEISRDNVAVAAHFADPQLLLEAARALQGHARLRLEAYTPHYVHGLREALGQPKSRLSWYVFACAVAGAHTAYAMQWGYNLLDYPMDIGGRPLHSWPAFVPITFELLVLFASVGAFVGVMVAARLPRLNHPDFEIPGFDRASSDGYLLVARDAHAQPGQQTEDHLTTAAKTLADLGAHDVKGVA